MGESFKFKIENPSVFKRKLFTWIQQFDVACVFDSHLSENPLHKYSFSTYEFLLAVGVEREISSTNQSSLEDLDKAIEEEPSWYFGYLSYELKNNFENLTSTNEDNLHWPDFFFFRPQILISIKNNEAEIQVYGQSFLSVAEIIEQIMKSTEYDKVFECQTEMQAKISREKYLESVKALKNHIIRGDIYEVNFCQEFFSFTEIDPYGAYLKLSDISPSPFGCFLRVRNNYLISASPERFLLKKGNYLISQPIKGTSARSLNEEEDSLYRNQLSGSSKERAENIMIVDLVRNDLSKIAATNTVKVEELCGLYSFKQVHQLISTLSCEIKTNSFDEIIKATFPMGSMTGAPKISAMQLAEKFESTKRGLYSGSVGYISPEKDFDLNVVIRSLQYNSENKYLSYMVGGAITGYSDAEQEYEECMIKASAIEKLLKRDEHA